MIVFRIPVEFEWDRWNGGKNFARHKVTDAECEEVFFDHYKRIARDVFHSGSEERYIVIGKTRGERLLFIVYTLRKQKIRVISARDLNKKELYLYEEKN